jgi:steroid 5-alpha reductase family enzyme
MSTIALQLLVNAGVALGVTVLLILIVFAFAVHRNRFDLIDSVWGLGFAFVAVAGFVLSIGEGELLARSLVVGLTVVWGVRLAGHIHRRNRGKDEDRRYVEMAQRAGEHVLRYMFIRVYLVQAAILWFVSLPVQFAQVGTGWGNPSIWIGVVVWAIGFAFEAIGDHQLSVFRADPANKGMVLDTGLWRYTRHPNYFGDACVWWGLYLIACHTWWGAATILSPVVMTLLLARGTGKPLLEKDIRERRPAYADYIERTSGFFPLPPRRAHPDQ